MQNTWIANTNSSIRFTPGVRGAGGSNYTLYLNRCQSNAGQNSFEIGYSTMIAWEVTQ